MAELSEKEIEIIILDYIPDIFPAEANAAAHAIAEKLNKGMVCLGTGMIVHDVDQEGNAEVYILLDSEPDELDSGQRVRVTVTKEE